MKNDVPKLIAKHDATLRDVTDDLYYASGFWIRDKI